MVFYKCDKCNKEFNQKCNYMSHINKKNSCICTNEDKNIIIYKCDKCNKEFNKKYNYITHVKRKIPCNGVDSKNNELLLKVQELENKLLEVEKENNKNLKLKENNKELENKNRELNKDNIIFKGENNMFKGENKTLKELLNNKDIEIKDLYKNIYYKTKDNDIKIKLIQEYIYILRECDFVRLNENIYKIGRTAKINPEDRFQKYRKGTEIIGFFKVNDSVECENKIIKCFSNHTNITKMKEYGKEYFKGDRNELLKEILQIVKNYNT
jgi:uncharacterized C2H2 Zn-finger protein